MEAREISAKETISASRKLGEAEAREIAGAASRIIVSKGKKVREFKGGSSGEVSEELVEAMLGSTGNLRAPLIRRGKTVLVGFNEAVYGDVFGS